MYIYIYICILVSLYLLSSSPTLVFFPPPPPAASAAYAGTCLACRRKPTAGVGPCPSSSSGHVRRSSPCWKSWRMICAVNQLPTPPNTSLPWRCPSLVDSSCWSFCHGGVAEPALMPARGAVGAGKDAPWPSPTTPPAVLIGL